MLAIYVHENCTAITTGWNKSNITHSYTHKAQVSKTTSDTCMIAAFS